MAYISIFSGSQFFKTTDLAVSFEKVGDFICKIM